LVINNIYVRNNIQILLYLYSISQNSFLKHILIVYTTGKNGNTTKYKIRHLFSINKIITTIIFIIYFYFINNNYIAMYNTILIKKF